MLSHVYVCQNSFSIVVKHKRDSNSAGLENISFLLNLSMDLLTMKALGLHFEHAFVSFFSPLRGFSLICCVVWYSCAVRILLESKVSISYFISYNSIFIFCFPTIFFLLPPVMETQSQTEVTRQNKMLPPKPGTFEDREDLVKYVRDFGASQGYVVTIKKSRKDRRVILGCDRGGVYRNRRKIDESKRKRKASSRLINCPFEAIGKKEDDLWVLTVKIGEHNHEALKDMSEHPYSRRFTEEEVRQIKQMTEAGVKPRQVLKALKQINPELQSTPRHLYNLKAKIRQGNLSGSSCSQDFRKCFSNRAKLLERKTCTIAQCVGG